MTKRILAIVLAMVMCLSILSVEVFASDYTAMTITAKVEGNAITISWNSLSNAKTYEVEVNKGGTTVSRTTVSGESTRISVNSYGTFNINVTAKDNSGKSIGGGSTTCTVEQNSTVNGINVTASGNTSTISWNGNGSSNYYVSYEYYNASNVRTNGGVPSNNTSVVIDVAYNKLISVSVQGDGKLIGTWTPSGNQGGNGNASGGVTYSGGKLYWSNSGIAYLNVVAGGQTLYDAYPVNSGIDISSIINQYSTSNIVFSVYGNAQKTNLIGSYTYYGNSNLGGGTGSTSGNVTYSSGRLYWSYNSTAYMLITVNGQNISSFFSVTSGTDISWYLSQYSGSNIVFTIYAADKATVIGSYTYYNYNNGTTTGNVWLNGTTVSWQGVGSQGYNVTVSYSGGTLLNQSLGNTTSINLANYIAEYYLRSYNLTITVTGTATGVIGTAYYYANGNYNTGVNGIKVEISGRNAVVSWDAVNNAEAYKIVYTIGGSQYQWELSNAQRTISLDYTRGLTVTVQYKRSNTYYTIGSATVSSSGVVSNNTVTNPGTSNTNGNTVTGINCTLTLGTNSSTLSWNAQAGALYYSVLYTNNVTNISHLINDVRTTSTTVPLGKSNCKSFTCQVIAYGSSGVLQNGPFANVSYNGNTDTSTNTSTGKTEIKGITLKENGTNSTTVTWDKVDGASYYSVSYYRADTNLNSEQNVTAKTSYELPFGKRIGFDVYVYAVIGNRVKLVGYANHAAGDPYTNTTSTPANDDEPAETIADYVTGFKGVATSNKVSLSWKGASGNPTYTIYWKRSSASEWKKAHTTSKRAVNLSGFSTGVTYDFKVVANGKDSGILTITTPSSGSTTKTAPDPEERVVETSAPEITSVSGSNGTIEVSWTKVTKATTYKVYFAKEGSTEYAVSTSQKYWSGAETTITGTTAKITGMKAGTYKVRIKASTDNGKTWTDLSDCDYRTVTVG